MKYELKIGAIIITLSLILTLLGSVVASLYHPSTTTERLGVIILFVLLGVIDIIVTICFQGERFSSNRLFALLRQYRSLWLLVLFVSLITLVGDNSQWLGIGARGTLLLICVIAIVGYIRDLHSRRRCAATTKVHWHVDELPFPYDFEKSKDKKV